MENKITTIRFRTFWREIVLFKFLGDYAFLVHEVSFNKDKMAQLMAVCSYLKATIILSDDTMALKWLNSLLYVLI